jgi:hypothetical protein
MRKVREENQPEQIGTLPRLSGTEKQGECPYFTASKGIIPERALVLWDWMRLLRFLI